MLKTLCVAFAIWALAATRALAVATTATPVTNAAWVSLGTGPLFLSVEGCCALYQVSDTAPAAGASGFPVPSTGVLVNTGSQVWVIAATAGGATMLSTPAANPAAIYSGQQTCTASAVALPSQALVNGVVVTAKATNTGTVYVGPSGETSATGYPLAAGQSISYAVANLSSIYILDAVTTDAVAFTGN